MLEHFHYLNIRKCQTFAHMHMQPHPSKSSIIIAIETFVSHMFIKL